MYCIKKITSNHVVDFAAEELKKYLRMMMPRCGEIDISYEPDAKDGFRLGLMADFGLDTSEADDVELDDILHIDTDEQGGIIAGSNPRSVLLAVYRYLTVNGCRWLFPGIDGEFIPVKAVEPTKYHKMADCRYRGQCNEGAESQPVMMDIIDFTPKIGMNIFMIEFDNPKTYYDKYYIHRHNDKVREPEPVSAETVLQWKRQCEVEIAKRGLQFHDIGHGWTAEAFGIETTGGWTTPFPDEDIPDEVRPFIAMMDGERKLFRDIPILTNFCMSNAEARRRVVNCVADYAQNASNVDYLHVWLADGSKNHCECEECRKKTPSDWYVMMMNEIDAELTARNLATRIVFICYVDTTWAPETVFIKNPDRFSLLVAAITRNYVEPVSKNPEGKHFDLPPFVLNKLDLPTDVDEYLAHAKLWRERCRVQSFVYEYHYCWIQYRDLGVLDAARIIHEDIKGYRANGCNGIVEDGSQRSFWPNGFSFYVYASTLFDTSVSFDALKEDYFSHAYGEHWREVLDFFERLGKAADFRYMNGALSSDKEKGRFYNPEFAKNLREAKKIVEEFVPFVKEHRLTPYRAQTVAYRMLDRYMIYCQGILDVLMLKTVGLGMEAQKAFYEFLDKFGVYELELETCYDQDMMTLAMRQVFGKSGLFIAY